MSFRFVRSISVSVFFFASLAALPARGIAFVEVMDRVSEVVNSEFSAEQRSERIYGLLLELADSCEASVAAGRFRNGLRHRAVAVAWSKYCELSRVLLEIDPDAAERIEERTRDLYLAFSRNREVRRLFQNFMRQESPEVLAFLETTIGPEIGQRRISLEGALNAAGIALGKIVGSIAWKTRGRVTVRSDLAEDLRGQLRPLDILFERKTYKLSNYSIPGYWGHVAVFLGTKRQLVGLGIWEAAELAPFRDRIEKGETIFEVRKAGTRYQAYDRWLNMDAVAVARKEGLGSGNREEILAVFGALAHQEGKPYDFAFDIADTKRITCTELLFLAYGDVEWPTRAFLGRRYIAPDDVARVVSDHRSGFELVSYLEGRPKGELGFRGLGEFVDRIGIVGTDGELLVSLP